MIDQYLSDISSNIIESLLNAFPPLKDNLISSIDEIRQSYASTLEVIKKNLPGYGKCYYISQDITLVENLNYYITYKEGFRVPDERTKKVRYYYEVEIDIEDVEKWLDELDEITTSNFYQQDGDFVKEIMRLLDKAMKKELYDI